MATVMPDSENIRKAVKWISAVLQEEPDRPPRQLIQEAALKFDLSPLETDFLWNFYKTEKEKIDKSG